MTKKIFLNTFLVGMAVLILCSAMFFGLQYRQNVDGTYNNLKENSVYVANGIAISGEDYLRTIDGSFGITWIDENGTVLFDSSGDSGQTDPMDLPEVRDAFGAAGEGMRETDSKGVTAVCYAVRLDDGTVLRLSDTSGAAMAALKAVSPVLWVFVLVLLLSLILAFRVAKDILRPVNSLDLDAPDVSSTYPELAPLVERIQEQNLTIRDQMNELYNRQKEFAALTDSMSEGFVLIDMRGSILSANSSALSLMDNAEIGSDLFKYTDDEIGSTIKSALGGERSESTITSEGRSWQIIANPVLVHRQVSGAVLLIMDVTEREQRERLRQEFSANVSHELKTPLTSISGFAELMMQGMVSENKVVEFSGDIYRESRRLITLVDDIIKLSKLDENAAAPTEESVDLYELAEDTLDSLRSVADKQNVTLELTGGPASVTGVWQLLSEMVYNLCDNAIKYNKEGGSVTVDVSETDSKVKLSVKDTGIGIPYGDQNRVFERFFRVDKSHSKEIGGTGLGLSIVKHGAQYLGAQVELNSTPGKGTTVTLTFQK